MSINLDLEEFLMIFKDSLGTKNKTMILDNIAEKLRKKNK